MKIEIQNILNLAREAPSGENCQPWYFRVDKNFAINVMNDPEKDQSLYNFEQRGSFVAHGALIENIRLVANQYGFQARIQMFPDPGNRNHVAKINLEKHGEGQAEPLAEYITKRSTNRKPYEKTPLTDNELTELTAAASVIGSGKIYFTQDRTKIKALAQATSVNEQVMFSNQSLHQFFFSHLNWNKAEEEQTRSGFYIKTLEMPPPAMAILKIAKNWNHIKLLNKLGFAKLVALGNAKTYAAASAFMTIVIPDQKSESFVSAGRILEQLWLTATKLGLSLQPLTGVLFFAQRIEAGQNSGFSDAHRNLILSAYETIRQALNATDGIIAMLVRIGRAVPPSATSMKQQPHIIFETQP